MAFDGHLHVDSQPSKVKARVRGMIRHDWVNDGLPVGAAPLHWSTSIEEANKVRTSFGLAALDPALDPAPDVALSWSPADETPCAEKREASIASNPEIPEFLQWTGTGRLLTFLLAATSIGCMLVDSTGLVTVRSFFFAILAPACLAIALLASVNRLKGDGQLFRAVASGALAGILGAVIFNIFRLPFVYSHELGLERLGIPHVPFFNLYPRIGALLVGQPVKQPSYALYLSFIGWGYHIIRAASTGIMFAAAIGEIRAEISASARHPISIRAITRGALLTVTIQACLLLSPYARLFSIELTPQRIFIIMLAHVSFGVSIACFYAWRSRSWSPTRSMSLQA